VSAALLADHAIGIVLSDMKVIEIVSWSFVGVFVVVLLALYYPHVTSLGVPLRSARQLLSLLPDELVDAIPDLGAVMREVATETQLFNRTRGVVSIMRGSSRRELGETGADDRNGQHHEHSMSGVLRPRRAESFLSTGGPDHSESSQHSSSPRAIIGTATGVSQRTPLR